MQYKLSKDQWLEIGKKAGWIKEAKGCWDGYKQIGMKKKKGKMVPNCVPENKK
jgi:hypothetical protein